MILSRLDMLSRVWQTMFIRVFSFSPSYSLFGALTHLITFIPLKHHRKKMTTILTPSFDLKQASALAELISSSVKTLVSSASDANGVVNGAHASKETAVRLATLQIVSAASQLVALVRPPEQTLMDVATGVSLLLRVSLFIAFSFRVINVYEK